MVWTKVGVYQIRRFSLAVLVLVLLSLIICSYVDINLSSFKTKPFRILGSLTQQQKYLINTSACKIPDLAPLNEDVLPFVDKEEYEPCSDKPLLSYIEKTREGEVKLKINESVIALYSAFSIKCCYSYILRKDGDSSVTHTSCLKFQSEVTLNHPHVKVVCKSFLGTVYQNVHATILTKEPSKGDSVTSNNKLKILMMGIDSVSRLNLERSLPKLQAYLERTFIGFKGYNKIEDNTFPNLMAILSGRSMDTLEPHCVRSEPFDNCDILWNIFKDYGVITAYGEDEPFLNTFTYYKKGFIDPPTSVYLRPYFLSAYLLPMTYKHSMGVCTGPQNTGERMLDAAKDFLVTFRNNSFFAFYWMNSFSHDNVNFASTMDEQLINFFTHSVVQEAMKDTVIIFFSDHGFRFGDIRFTYSGWLEERLPFLYVYFPERFRQINPHYLKNFQFNAHTRLTTPYDLYMTLQDLLKMYNDSYAIRPSPGCPKCKSLFALMPESRSCEDAGIPRHYCTCDGYSRVSLTDPAVLAVAEFVVKEVNDLINGFGDEGSKCATFTLKTIETVVKSDTDAIYLILVKTYPYAMFEATVRVKKNNDHELLGQISRLNKYGAYSSCVHNDILKKYCFCDSWSTLILSNVCYLFKCQVY
ncbi:uncharacterized protein LOC126745656 isoform X2 [Anthonomus grandis grandis]|uniref:uncharacterized protein LOC126745656 isoform X2 n=1 Tax=Anthonomus grandis grandis TaxID=2921223 RepID=UPI0021650C18|nr:uncharacterized protein LOC126745656 isoform X2 [Anthonomus grandis grandis]